MPKKKKVRAGKKTTKPELAASWPSLPPDFPPSPKQRRRSITDLGPHEHAAFLFSDEAEWAAVVPSFIVSGLEKNEKCVVILDSHEINLLRQPLVRAGLNIEAVMNSGQLVIIPAAEAYLRRGSFSPEEMITFLKEETEKALSEGYAALRATGEMTWALRPSSDLGKLFEYEARLNHDFFPHYPCIGLCQYDRRRFTGAALKEIVLSHPLLSFHDGVYQNFYYFPPKEYFDPRRAELEVDRWLKNLIDEHSALEAMEENAERFRSLYQNSTIGLYRTTPDGRILLANPTLVRMLGYDSFEELAPRNLEKDGFEPSYPRAKFIEKIEKEGEVRGVESAWKRRDGTIIYVRESARAIRDASGRTLFYDGTVEDITEKKLAEEKLLSSLQEKEVLLKEVHHRVKNNLQVIISLLRLQSRYLDDPRLLELLQASQNRIRSMAMIHEQLYASQNFARVDFDEYIKNLITHLYVVYGVSPNRVSFKVQAAKIYLDINRAIPCGMIINELVSNALRHAFPENRQGEIIVSLKQDEIGRFYLLVKDNGVGLPEAVEVEKAATLGLQIVRILVHQLGGSLRVIRSHGTTFSISF